MRFPSKKRSPLSGSKNPPIILSVVVLPQPLGPNRVINSLSLISKLILSSIISPSKETSTSFKEIIVFSFNLCTPICCVNKHINFQYKV